MLSEVNRVRRTAEPHSNLIGQHQQRVWNLLRWLGCSGEEADDLTQDVFLALLRSSFVARSPGETWVYLRTTATRMFRTMCQRSGRKIEEAYIEGVVASESEQGTDEAELDALRVCVEALPGRSRQVLGWFYADGLSWEEIGERLDRRGNGVKTMLQRLRVRLRVCVERQVRSNQ